MSRFTFEDYEASQARKNSAQSREKQLVSYFGLKNDGDEAIVRFAYKDPSEFEFLSVHQVKVGDKFRRVNCLRSPKDPLDKCPLCGCGDEAAARVFSKFYVKLVEYVRDEKGSIVAVPKIWERTPKFAKTLAGYFSEYGDLSEIVFKVKRHGAARSMDTYYDVIPGNQMIYKPDIYVKDFSAFETYSVLKYVVLDKTAEEMSAYLQTGEFPEVDKSKNLEKVIESPAEEKKVEQALGFGYEVKPQATTEAVPAKEETPATSEPESGRPVRRYVF